MAAALLTRGYCILLFPFSSRTLSALSCARHRPRPCVLRHVVPAFCRGLCKRKSREMGSESSHVGWFWRSAHLRSGLHNFPRSTISRIYHPSFLPIQKQVTKCFSQGYELAPPDATATVNATITTASIHPSSDWLVVACGWGATATIIIACKFFGS